MKKTKDYTEKISKKNDDSNKILTFISKEDAIEFKRIASGRKFCKKGEKLVDICDDEIDRYNFEKHAGILQKLFRRHKYNKKKEKLLLENRTSSIIRAIVVQTIEKYNEEELDRDKIKSEVKQYILKKVEEYNKSISKAS